VKHDLKIWPQYFCRVADGSKTFEVRKNDRGFQPGDEVELREWDPEAKPTEHEEFSPGGTYVGSYYTPNNYTGRSISFRVGYVLPVDAERVVFSLLPLQPSKDDKR
jgi:hypothetical protein